MTNIALRMNKMTNPLRLQIEGMEPRRYARAAKRAAKAAETSARKEGIEVSARIRHLLDSTEEQLAGEQRARLAARAEGGSPAGGEAGGNPAAQSESRPDKGLELHNPLTPSVEASTGLATAARAAVLTLLPTTLPTTLSGLGPSAASVSASLATTFGPSLLSIWLQGEEGQERSVFVEAAVERPIGRDLPLLKGEGMMSADGCWRVSWTDAGDLSVIVRGDEPWSTPVADEDVVTVDPATGTIVVKGTNPRSVWTKNPIEAAHRSIGRRVGDHVQVIRIRCHERSFAPTVIASPTWERIRSMAGGFIEDEVHEALPTADVV